ncbi:MAG: HEAT repeat domain-containing protein [Cyanophyceae cyanobacterium]
MNTENLIQAVEQSHSSASLISAVSTLAAAHQEEAIPTLVKVLGFNNPGAAAVAVDGLVALGEPAVAYLLNNLDSYDYGARAWATRALAEIGDPRALSLLLEAARGDFALSVRRAAAKGLGNLQWSKFPPQQRAEAQKQVLQTLATVTRDSEWVVGYAAVVGLQSLASSVAESLAVEIKAQLQQVAQTHSDAAVCARAQLALQQQSSALR